MVAETLKASKVAGTRGKPDTMVIVVAEPNKSAASPRQALLCQLNT